MPFCVLVELLNCHIRFCFLAGRLLVFPEGKPELGKIIYPVPVSDNSPWGHH